MGCRAMPEDDFGEKRETAVASGFSSRKPQPCSCGIPPVSSMEQTRTIRLEMGCRALVSLLCR
jgi:hypothetical protein